MHKPHVFVHAACDNDDLSEETLDGMSTSHITTTAVFQGAQREVEFSRVTQDPVML